jgi:flagellin-specific chaperone FliS
MIRRRDTVDCDIGSKLDGMSKAQLIVALHNRAISDLEGAAKVLRIVETVDPRAVSEALGDISHARKIVEELSRCLNPDTDLGKNLQRLYTYVRSKTFSAESGQSADDCDQAAGLLRDLGAAFAGCVEKLEKEKGG